MKHLFTRWHICTEMWSKNSIIFHKRW